MSLYLDGVIDHWALHNNGRQLSYIPHHFVTVLDASKTFYSEDDVRTWIWRHFTGRFSMSNNRVSFEDPGEATMFSLLADQFKFAPV